jgi:hypothetical protein
MGETYVVKHLVYAAVSPDASQTKLPHVASCIARTQACSMHT